MSILRGEDVVIGVAPESVRGTFVNPTFWIPGRSPSGIRPIQDRVAIKETRGNKLATTGEEIVQERAEGDLEMNVRVQSIGLILKSLLGEVASVSKGGANAAVYDHTFHLLNDNPAHPSVSFGLHQPGVQDYDYRLGMVTKLELEVTPTDLVMAKMEMGAVQESAHSGSFTPSYSTADAHFRHHDITIKLAANVAGLGAAPALLVKNIKCSLDNGGRPEQDVSQINPNNMLAGEVKFGGSFELNHVDSTYQDLFKANTARALQISMVRSDITIGASANPGIVITFPKIQFNDWNPNRPIEEIVRQALQFNVHQPDSGEPIEIIVTNLITSY